MPSYAVVLNKAKDFLLGQRRVVGGTVWPAGHEDCPNGRHEIYYFRLDPFWKIFLNIIRDIQIKLRHDGITVWLWRRQGFGKHLIWWAAFWWKRASGYSNSNRFSWRAGK